MSLKFHSSVSARLQHGPIALWPKGQSYRAALEATMLGEKGLADGSSANIRQVDQS